MNSLEKFLLELLNQDLIFGDLKIFKKDHQYLVQHKASLVKLKTISLDQLGDYLRLDSNLKYRPLLSFKNLRNDWIIKVTDLKTLIEVIDQIYPLALLHSFQAKYKTLRIVSPEEVLKRQSGKFAKAKNINSAEIFSVEKVLCSKCIKKPAWRLTSNNLEVCPEACSLFVSLANIVCDLKIENREIDHEVDLANVEHSGNILRLELIDHLKSKN